MNKKLIYRTSLLFFVGRPPHPEQRSAPGNLEQRNAPSLSGTSSQYPLASSQNPPPSKLLARNDGHGSEEDNLDVEP